MNTTTTTTTTSNIPAPADNFALMNEVLTAYEQAVSNLKNCPPAMLAEARRHLEMGCIERSKVVGVHSTAAASELLRRVILSGTKKDTMIDREGNTVMCFDLTHHYNGKGISPLVRMRDWCKDRSNRALCKIQVDYDAETDEEYLRIAAPEVPESRIPSSNKITIILGPNREFVGWHCGEPHQIYAQDNVEIELLCSHGLPCADNQQIEVALDYDRRSENRRCAARQAKYRKNRNKHYPNNQNKPAKPGVNNLGQTAELSQDTQEIMARLENPDPAEEMGSVPVTPAQNQ